MNIFNDFAARVRSAAERALGPFAADIDLTRIVVEPPRDATHGDLATNAAMVLAKPLRQNPKEVATRIAAILAADPDVNAAEVAGPGFINLRLRDVFWQDALRALIADGADFGRTSIGASRKINVEFVSANPTGPMHVGHSRVTV